MMKQLFDGVYLLEGQVGVFPFIACDEAPNVIANANLM
jgi:hypothetical protein